MRRSGWVLRCVLVAMVFVSAGAAIAGQVGATEHPSGAAEVTVVTDQTGGQVSLKVGAVLEVRMEANHTTGYSWIAAPVTNPVLVRQGPAKYEEHATGGKVGVGGVEVWRFKAVKGGKQGLQFAFERFQSRPAVLAKAGQLVGGRVDCLNVGDDFAARRRRGNLAHMPAGAAGVGKSP